jgi:hypothetical protein
MSDVGATGGIGGDAGNKWVGEMILPPSKPGSSNVTWRDIRSIVVVGANGTGKSQLGCWIESNARPSGHRITAQRALTIPGVVRPRPFDQAEAELLYGHFDAKLTREGLAANKFGYRWGEEPATQLLDDFDALLATLFADERKRNGEYTRSARTSLPTAVPPPSKLDVLQEIWASVMPQRLLLIGEDRVEAKKESGKACAGIKMSDGERVALYLIGQSLCASPGAVVIIDEPEIHLHRAIQSPLWDRIEAARLDCAFVYLTHDLDFAASRVGARKIWLKAYDHNVWEWEEIHPNPALPDALLYQVLGSRRPVLFVEGDETSYDTAVYSALFPKDLVLPRQNCQKVIEATKSMAGLTNLHHNAVRGLIDRDRRSDNEIEALKKAGLLVADVAEVENLLCVSEALLFAATHLNHPDPPAVAKAAEERVLDELRKDLHQQALSRALAAIQFRLNGFGPRTSSADAAALATALQDHVNSIDVHATYENSRTLLKDVVDRADYSGALRYYNCKGIPAFVAMTLGIEPEVYCRIILARVKTEPDGAVAKAMKAALNI